MKNLYLGYAKADERYRRNVVEPICDLVKFMGREIDKRDPKAWFSTLTIPIRQRVVSAEIYDYVEIMP